ncbi:hypothetical protein BS78_08G065600 [Paspalum vaginatum]|nr:hypothetical protein BS78_08G065600 [Paspalum vaginatum]
MRSQVVVSCGRRRGPMWPSCAAVGALEGDPAAHLADAPLPQPVAGARARLPCLSLHRLPHQRHHPAPAVAISSSLSWDINSHREVASPVLLSAILHLSI